jgi:hypothetical protein
MTRNERWAFNVLVSLVSITGVIYFVMKYLMSSQDPFAVINHPWEPTMLSAHIVLSPLLVLSFGVIFRSHILKKFYSDERANRRTGWTSLVCFGVMGFSGYLLQVVASPALLRALVFIHVVSSLVFIVGYSVHFFVGSRMSSQESVALTPASSLRAGAKRSL